jgi:hypothetical protein
MLFAVSFYTYGQELIPAQCSSAIGGNMYGYKDKKTDKMVIPCNYAKVWNFSEQIEGLAKVLRNTTPTDSRPTLKYGFIDKSGKEVIPLKYDELFQFSEDIQGWAKVKLNGKFGFVDKTGKEVIAAKYSNSEFKFSEGLAPVKVGNYFGYIDKNGKEVIPFNYVSVGAFFNGLAKVKDKQNEGYIDVANNFYKGKDDKEFKKRKEQEEFNAILEQIERANKAESQRRVETE